MTKPKIMIIGLDAATWDLVGPWAKQGLLPNLSKLVEEGASGKLQSAIPPLTPPAWTSFMTGQNPGKHGIFHFLEAQPGGYSMRYSNGSSRRAPTLWKMLSDAGHSVGVINVPFTYPPEAVNGYQIAGMDTPSEKSAFVYPPALREELERELGPMSLEIRFLGFVTNDRRRDEVLRGLESSDEQWLRVALYLMEKHPVDVMMCTFMSIDTAQHYFWHFMDEKHFQFDRRGAQKYQDAIRNVYERLDRAVGKLLEKLPGDCTVCVVSDHGGGPVSDRVIYLNRYLAQLGLLKYKSDVRGRFARTRQGLIRKVFESIRGSLTSDQKKWLAANLPHMRQKFEGAYSSYADINWPETKAFCSEILAYPPSISINLEGVYKHGIVKVEEYEELRALLIEKLGDLRDPRDGSPIVPRVYRREELFHGPFAREAPDLVLDWWSDKAFTTSLSFADEGDEPFLKIRKREPMKRPEWAATHRLEGILLIRGPNIRKSVRIEGARLVDMVPTLLHLLGEEIPAGLDGAVLNDLFEPEFLRSRPVQSTDPVAAPEALAEKGRSPYNDEEAAQVEERLKALGYID
jgi:predicted AlkP superfamily phosphohydrolase/phosphomutase